MQVKIRFNTNYLSGSSPKKWRVLVNNVERLVDDIEIRCTTYTTEDEVEVDGKKVKKWHLTCTPKKIHEEKRLSTEPKQLVETKIILS